MSGAFWICPPSGNNAMVSPGISSGKLNKKTTAGAYDWHWVTCRPLNKMAHILYTAFSNVFYLAEFVSYFSRPKMSLKCIMNPINNMSALVHVPEHEVRSHEAKLAYMIDAWKCCEPNWVTIWLTGMYPYATQVMHNTWHCKLNNVIMHMSVVNGSNNTPGILDYCGHARNWISIYPD